jgi:release factor glutamine methyltransferase
MSEVLFHGLPVLTSRGVMTPRRTSEALVRTAVEIVGDRRVRVADVGTGSGAIAVALAVALPRAEIFATDTNPAAVALTRDNVDRLGLSDRVTVYTGELLEPVAAPLDLVVANLPYLPIAEAPWHRELAEEPRDAVFAPGDGLGLYRCLIEASRERLGVDGSLVLQLRRQVMTARRAELDGLSRALAAPGPHRGPTGPPRSRRLRLAESAKRAAPYVSRLALAGAGRRTYARLEPTSKGTV